MLNPRAVQQVSLQGPWAAGYLPELSSFYGVLRAVVRLRLVQQQRQPLNWKRAVAPCPDSEGGPYSSLG